MSSMVVLVILAIALLIMTVVLGVALFLFLRYQSPDPSLLQQRLSRIKHYKETETPDTLPKVSRFYKEAEYKNEELGRKLEQYSFFLTLKLRIQQSGLKTTSDKFFISNMAIPIAVSGFIGIVMQMPLLVFAGIFFAAGSYAYVLFMRTKRYGKFVAMMPDALSMITSALKAGHSFQSALSVVATDMTDPISTEFASLVRDINLGIPVKEALNRMVIKLDAVPDVRMFTTAVNIQREAGGNLAEVLEKLSYTIRERFKLKGQIAALTGQSRMTGYVLGAAPALILVFLSLCMYDYVRPLYETEMGHLALIAVIVLQSVGFLVMKKIIDIRV